MVLTDDPPLYRDLMRLKPDELTPNGWAVRAGVSRTVWSDMRRHGNPSRRTLEKLLAAAGSSLAEFEALRIGEEPVSAPEKGSASGLEDSSTAGWRAAPLPPLPLFAAEVAELALPDGPIEACRIDFGQAQGRVSRPPSLAGDPHAYAVILAGGVMWPRFRVGRTLIVSPAARPEVGDDVIVRLARHEPNGPALALVRELAGSTSQSLTLQQFTPDLVFDLGADRVDAVHKILGEAI